jgi:DNA-binding response OmpR family regulator
MSPARLLIVEDDPHITKLLCQYLNGEGFETFAVACGEDALTHVREAAPDLIILDLMLSGMDGVETILTLRNFYFGPVLMLTAHEGEMQEVIALNAGVDDFIHKPIRPHILKARIQALLRRHAPAPAKLSIAGFRVEYARRRVLFNGATVDLTESEFELLWALASRAGEVVTRDALFQRLRNKEYDGLDRSIDMRVLKLRKKLAAFTDRDLIRTLRQLGYVFIKD